MVVLRISTSEPLLGAFAGALVRDLNPSVHLVRGEVLPADVPGVRIDLVDSGRWMFVCAGREALVRAAAALANGASAVVTTDSDVQDFERALDALLSENESYVPARMVRGIAHEVTQQKAGAPAEGPAQDLTARERDVLRLVALGFSNTEIADELTISANTVRSHLHALSVKLQAPGRMKMLANARSLQIPEAFATDLGTERHQRRVPA